MKFMDLNSICVFYKIHTHAYIHNDSKLIRIKMSQSTFVPTENEIQVQKIEGNQEKRKETIDLLKVFFNEETYECDILHDICDNPKGCNGCYHSWQQWMISEIEKGKNPDNSSRESYLDYLMTFMEESL